MAARLRTGFAFFQPFRWSAPGRSVFLGRVTTLSRFRTDTQAFRCMRGRQGTRAQRTKVALFRLDGRDEGRPTRVHLRPGFRSPCHGRQGTQARIRRSRRGFVSPCLWGFANSLPILARKGNEDGRDSPRAVTGKLCLAFPRGARPEALFATSDSGLGTLGGVALLRTENARARTSSEDCGLLAIRRMQIPAGEEPHSRALPAGLPTRSGKRRSFMPSRDRARSPLASSDGALFLRRDATSGRSNRPCREYFAL